jgi:hypothetical protein
MREFWIRKQLGHIWISDESFYKPELLDFRIKNAQAALAKHREKFPKEEG